MYIAKKSMNKFKYFITVITLFYLNQILVAQVPRYIPKDSLVGWWPFNGSANDESGNQNNGIVYGASLVADRNGKLSAAYSFDGVDDKMLFNVGHPDEFTICMWYKGVLNPDVSLSLFQQKASCNSLRGISVRTYNQQINISYGIRDCENTGSRSLEVTSNSLKNNYWHHLAFVRNKRDSLVQLYIDGNLVKNQFFFETEVNKKIDENLYLGVLTDRNTIIYNKAIKDDIGYWKRKLTATEIKSIYEAVDCSLVIDYEPKDTISNGQEVGFMTSVNDTTSKYQWQTNQGLGWVSLSEAGQFYGVKTNKLVLKNITMGNDRQLFRCLISGFCGKDTTREAKLIVLATNRTAINHASFAISPNPVCNTLNISGLNEKLFDFRVMALTGELLLIGGGTGSIDISTLKSGVYLLSINQQSLKFIVEK